MKPAQPIKTASHSCQSISAGERVGEPITARGQHSEPITAPDRKITACANEILAVCKTTITSSAPEVSAGSAFSTEKERREKRNNEKSKEEQKEVKQDED